MTKEEMGIIQAAKKGERLNEVSTALTVKMCAECRYCILNLGECYMIDNKPECVCKNFEPMERKEINVDNLLNSDRVEVSYLNSLSADFRMLENIMTYHKLTVAGMANVFGVRESTMQHWLDGRDIPNSAKMLIVVIYKHPEVVDMIRTVKVIKGGEENGSNR